MDTGPNECAICAEYLPAYVDYIIAGRSFPNHKQVEEHLALCPACASEYADLLGIALCEQAEQIQDLVMDIGPKASQAPMVELARASGLDLALALELNQHWLETCRNQLVQDARGAASALSHIGILHEMLGNLDGALAEHTNALSLADETGNKYARSRSLASKGRIKYLQGKWSEALESLRAAHETTLEIGDQFAQVRCLITLGDCYSSSRRLSAIAEALQNYSRATEEAERIGFLRALETANGRQDQLKAGLIGFFQRVARDFVQKFIKKERGLFEQFCQDLTSQLAALVSGGRPAPKFAVARLGFGGTSSGAKTPAILLTIISALDELVDWRPVEISDKTISTEERQTVVPVLREDAKSDVIRHARQLGLSRREARDLADYLENFVSREQEFFAEPRIDMPESKPD